MRGASAILLSTLLLTACPKKGSSAGPNRDLSQFECNSRRVEYMVAGSFAAQEAGVSMNCEDNDPKIIKWRVVEGNRSEKRHPLTAAQFDRVWERVDSTGWRHLEEECNNPDAAFDDPSYVIDVANHSHNVSLSCDGKTLPFPYDRIVNELDLRAAGFGEQDGPAR